ncbi:hypothetical protein DSCO28_02330 [Desulfosarcina ovata subsp. sediminis]|uniref:Uncharacterized protein n=1 Tax=Desulfosarcina ovata subsp. sediminis TaxID=885957 RepID=A0A5K7ZI86_9BACT|nr:hypothetical protein [Desulfosarcina ovata]BBO79667.1 hypothetical protein DSCO28_02330 [Desulfosarcina ovata subsp. sediminis]
MLPVPPQGYLGKSEAMREMFAFINAGDVDMPVPLPKRAYPRHAAEFVAKMLESDALVDREINQLGVIMRFFDLREQVSGLERHLLRKVTDRNDWECAVSALTIYCDLTSPQLAEPGMVNRYQLLAVDASRVLPRLVDLTFHLPDNIDTTIVRDVLLDGMKHFEPAVKREEDDALVEFYALEDLRDDRLTSVIQAKAGKTEIFNTSDLRKQRQLITLLYLQLVRNPYLDLPTWAAMMLQRDCNQSEPEQLAEAMSENLDMIITRAKKQEPLSEDDLKDAGKYLTRCARTVTFYGGVLTDEQSAYLERCYNSGQVDLLHWEEA